MKRMTVLAGMAILGAFLSWTSTMAQETDTKVIPAAKKTRELLKILKDAVQELKDQVKGLVIRIDSKGGVSQNGKLTFKASDKPVSEVLEGMFAKNGLGYVIINNAKDAYPGAIMIKQGKERGTLINSR